jgi:hypothetical protein
VQLVHRLWLTFKRDPEMQDLHHSDIVSYALTRLASEYARDRAETIRGLRRCMQSGSAALPAPRTERLRGAGYEYTVRAPKADDDNS